MLYFSGNVTFYIFYGLVISELLKIVWFSSKCENLLEKVSSLLRGMLNQGVISDNVIKQQGQIQKFGKRWRGAELVEQFQCIIFVEHSNNMYYMWYYFFPKRRGLSAASVPYGSTIREQHVKAFKRQQQAFETNKKISGDISSKISKLN